MGSKVNQSQSDCCFCVSYVQYARVLCAALFLLAVAEDLGAAEWSLEANLSARYEYNDNVLVTTDPHESVSNIIIQPDLKFRAEELNWESMFEARLRSNHFSDSSLDSNDQYYLIDGSYNHERDTYSIKTTYDLDSSLNAELDDFGTSQVRVNRTVKSISPTYSRMLTERLVMSLGYALSASDYDDLVNTGFVSYEAEIGTASLAYNLTERDKINASVQYTDYMSENEVSEFQLLAVRAGLSRQFSETFMADILIGTTGRDSINRGTSTIDFFGTLVSVTQENKSNDSGFVLDTGFEYKDDTGTLAGRLSRDNVTSSYGGVNEVDTLSLDYASEISERWGYNLEGKYQQTSSVLSSVSSTDRNVLIFSVKTDYLLAKNWKINAFWRYLQREYINQSNSNKPDSNKLYIGMTYNYSELSTF